VSFGRERAVMFPAAAACVNGLNISSSTSKSRCRECHCSSPTFAPAKVMLLFHGGDNFPWPTLSRASSTCISVGPFSHDHETVTWFRARACMLRLRHRGRLVSRRLLMPQPGTIHITLQLFPSPSTFYSQHLVSLES